MPRSDRAKRDADKKNKETANATGQTKMASFFKSQETGQTSTHSHIVMKQPRWKLPFHHLQMMSMRRDPKCQRLLLTHGSSRERVQRW